MIYDNFTRAGQSELSREWHQNALKYDSNCEKNTYFFSSRGQTLPLHSAGTLSGTQF